MLCCQSPFQNHFWNKSQLLFLQLWLSPWFHSMTWYMFFFFSKAFGLEVTSNSNYTIPAIADNSTTVSFIWHFSGPLIPIVWFSYSSSLTCLVNIFFLAFFNCKGYFCSSSDAIEDININNNNNEFILFVMFAFIKVFNYCMVVAYLVLVNNKKNKTFIIACAHSIYIRPSHCFLEAQLILNC